MSTGYGGQGGVPVGLHGLLRWRWARENTALLIQGQDILPRLSLCSIFAPCSSSCPRTVGPLFASRATNRADIPSWSTGLAFAPAWRSSGTASRPVLELAAHVNGVQPRASCDSISAPLSSSHRMALQCPSSAEDESSDLPSPSLPSTSAPFSSRILAAATRFSIPSSPCQM